MAASDYSAGVGGWVVALVLLSWKSTGCDSQSGEHEGEVSDMHLVWSRIGVCWISER